MATLKTQIKSRLDWARRNPDKRTRLDLAHGLGITLYVDVAGNAHVLLTRTGKIGPSAQEAQTVLEHWPTKLPALGAIEWKPGTSKVVSWLAATVPGEKRPAGTQLTLEQAGQ